MPGTKLGFKFGGTTPNNSTDLGETFVRRDYFERKPLYLAESNGDGSNQSPQVSYLFGAEASGVGQTGYYIQLLPELINSDDWVRVATGGEVSAGIKRDGTLWTWGSGASGVLGLGDTNARSVPTQVGTDTDWIHIEIAKEVAPSFSNTGTYFNGYVNVSYGTTNLSDPFMIGLKSNGTIWGWGGNTWGQNGTGAQRLTPTQIGSDSNWVQISAGSYHAVALKGDGTIWSWGWNGAGQLGLGDTTNRSSPTQIGSEKDWASIRAQRSPDTGATPNSGAYGFTTAIKSNGQLYLCGKSSRSVSPLGTQSNTLILFDDPNNSNWKSVVINGDGCPIGIKTDGSLWVSYIDWSPSYKFGPLKQVGDSNWRQLFNYRDGATGVLDYDGNASWFYVNSYAAGDPVVSTSLFTSKKWYQVSGGLHYALGIELRT